MDKMVETIQLLKSIKNNEAIDYIYLIVKEIANEQAED